MKEKLARFVIRYRVFFVIFPVLITFFSFLPLKKLRIETNLGEFVPEKHPYIKVQKKLEEIFGGLNQVNVVIKVKKGTIFRRDILEKIYNFTEELYFTEGVNISRINGIAARKMRKVQADEIGFKIERLMPDVPQTEEEIESLKQAIMKNPMVYGVFVSKDLTSTLIQADFFSGIPSKKIFEKIRNLAEKIKSPDIEIYYSGRPILEGYLDIYLSNLWYLFIFSIFVLGFFLFLSFRSKRGVILPVVSALMSTLWGLSFLSLTGFNLTPSTILVPFLILALGVSHSVQFIKRYYEESVVSKDRNSICFNVLYHLITPASISILTDGIGFLSLSLIPLKLIKTMSFSAGIGVLSIFLTTVFFIPSILTFIKLPEKEEIRREEKKTFVDSFLEVVSNFVISKRKVVYSIFIFLAFAGIGGISRIKVGDNQPGSPALYPNSHYNVSERVINKEFSGTDPYYILVEGKVPEAIVSADVLKEMDDLQNYIVKNLPEAGRAISLVDYIKGFNMIFNGGKFSYYKIPELDATIGEYLFLYSMSGFPGDFDHVVSPDFKNANIKIDMKDHRTSTINKVLSITEKWIKENHKTDRVEFLYPGGIIGILASLNDTIRKSIPQSLLIVSVLIFLFASFYLKSIVQAVYLLIPLFFSILFTFGIMGYTGVPLTIESLPLASLGLGLGVDYGIYIISRMRETEKDKIIRTLLTTGKAVFFTAFSVSLGILVWIFSPVKMAAKLGICLSSLLLLNMISSLVLLPSIFFNLKREV